MLVHTHWDSDDIYGAMAVYKALKPKDVANDKVFLTLGPWYHGQAINDGSSFSALRFNSDTSLWFRREILRPFLDRYLKDEAPATAISPVAAFETGTNTWQRLEGWPAGCEWNCAIHPTNLYLNQGLQLSFNPPQPALAPFDEYISDPATPVPYRVRAASPEHNRPTWPQWLVDDRREMSGRPDVLTFKTAVLSEPLKIGGQPTTDLSASTNGTDSDWIVKLIDVYPEEVAEQPSVGGNQLMIGADIFRGHATARAWRNPYPSSRISRSSTASSRCRRRIMSSFPDIASWFRPSRHASRCMTVIRNPSPPIFSRPNPPITARPFSASTTRRAQRALWNCLSSPDHEY